MPIIDGEVRTLGPVDHVLLGRRSSHVEDDGHPVFIVVPLDALMGVGCVGDDVPMGFRCVFSFFKVLQGVCSVRIIGTPIVTGHIALEVVIT
jgi:hypothetical protein